MGEGLALFTSAAVESRASPRLTRVSKLVTNPLHTSHLMNFHTITDK